MIDADARARARQLRHALTETEARLWSSLRGHRLGGHRFRRQHPVGSYVLDFYCPAARLGIEVDGPDHLDREDRDEARSKWLEGQGIEVIRFWNHEVSGELEAVLQAILDRVEARLGKRQS